MKGIALRSLASLAMISCWTALSISAAGETPVPAEATPAEQETIRLLISGELARLWEGKDVLEPRGGLGDSNHGVLGALAKATQERPGISILMGNNLGRAVKADAETGTTGLRGAKVQALESALSLDLKGQPQWPQEQLEWLARYARAGLSFERCQDAFARAAAGEKLDPALECDNDLFLWQIERNFAAVALGLGDFNDTSPEQRLRELRHYPFVASNLFLKSDQQYRCKGKHCKQPYPFDFDNEILPTDPLVLKLPNGKLSDLEKIEVEEVRVRSPIQPFATQRKLIFLPSKTTAASRFEHIYRTRVGMSHRVVMAASGVKVDDGKLTLNWPVPLWPNSVYEVTVTWSNANEPPAPVITFNTFALFTLAKIEPRPEQPSLVGSGPTVGLQDRPILYAPALDTLGTEMPGNPWVWNGVPVIDLSKVSVSQVKSPLYLLSVLDEQYRPYIDKLPEHPGDSIPLINQLHFMPMERAVAYWRDLVELLHTPQALERVKNAVEAGDDLGPEYTTFKGLRGNEPDGSGWSSDCSWRLERQAWKFLEDGPVASNDPCADWVNIGPAAASQHRFDLRVASLAKTVERFRRQPVYVLLAQAETDRARQLSKKFNDLALVVGQPAHDAAGPKAGKSAVFGSPYEPVRVHPEEFAKTLEDVEIQLASNSPLKVAEVSHLRREVIGAPLELLHESESSNLTPCCKGGSELERLTRTAIVNKDVPLSDAAAAGDRDHLRQWLKLRMRERAKAEVALLEEGVIDPEALDWLRSLRWLLEMVKKGKLLDVNQATVEQLAQIPGIDVALARKIKAYHCSKPISTRDELRDFWDKHVDDPDGAAWSWVRWFIHDPSDLGMGGLPYVDHEFLVDQFFRRTAFTNYHLWKVTLTEDQLEKLRKALDAKRFALQGLSKESKTRYLHFKKLEGKAPVTVALMSNLASEEGPFSVLAEGNVLRTSISSSEGETVSLQQLVRELGDEAYGPKDPPADWVKAEVERRDRRGAWLISLNAAGLEFQDVQTSQGFMVETNDKRTETKEQRRIGFKPELVLSRRGQRLDWTNTLKSEYETNRIGPNSAPNPLNDSWSVRSEWDFFLQERNRVNFPLYTSVSWVSQWRRRLQEVKLGDSFTESLTFPLNKRRELLSEYGAAITNRAKSKFFRFGFVVGGDFNQITSATVTHPVESIPAVSGTPSQIAQTIQGSGLICPGPDSERNDCYRPDTSLGVQLDTVDRLRLGLAFRGQYEVEFGHINGDKKFKYTTKLTDGNFFFHRTNSLPGQPRLRLQLANELSIPLFGNLSVVPGVEWFLFRNVGGVDAMGVTVPRQTFWSLRPYLRVDYRFDLKPAFMRLRDGFKFKNR